MTRDDLEFLFLALTLVAALAGLPLTILEIVDKALDIEVKLRRARRKKSGTLHGPAPTTHRVKRKTSRRKR